MANQSEILRFEAFELDCGNRQLRHRGVAVELGSRYFDALTLLVARPGELVTKNEFMDAVWHGVPVTDEALTQCIRTLRRALNDDASNPRFIQTIPKHGYRFIAAALRPKEPVAYPHGPIVAGVCTVAGTGAGAVAGLFYGIMAGTGGGGQVLILAAMIGALGLLAGAGLGTGMAAAITWRRRADWWTVAGAALGGLCVGAIGNLLGREGVGLLSGISIDDVTGPLEGVILGTATGLSVLTVSGGHSGRSVLATATLAATAAGVLIHFAGGTLLAGSLHALEQGVPGTQLRMEQIGMLASEAGLTATVRTASAIVESLVFMLSNMAALLAVRNRFGNFAHSKRPVNAS